MVLEENLDSLSTRREGGTHRYKYVRQAWACSTVWHAASRALCTCHERRAHFPPWGPTWHPGRGWEGSTRHCQKGTSPRYDGTGHLMCLVLVLCRMNYMDTGITAVLNLNLYRHRHRHNIVSNQNMSPALQASRFTGLQLAAGRRSEQLFLSTPFRYPNLSYFPRM